MGLFGDKVPKYIKMLDPKSYPGKTNWKKMEKAAKKLGKLRDERAAEPLLNYATISHNTAALDALVSIGGSKAAVALSELYHRSDDARIARERRGYGMDHIGGPRTVWPQVIWLNHIEDAIRKMKREDIFWSEIRLCPSCGSEFTPSSERYLFNWNEIPGNDNERVMKYIQKLASSWSFLPKFAGNWVKTAKIEKNEDGKTIKVSTDKNYLSLKLDDDIERNNRAILKTDDGTVLPLIAIRGVKRGIREIGIYEKRVPMVCPTCEEKNEPQS